MVNRFLKAKHWQLFLLVFGLPIILQFILFGYMFSSMLAQTNPDPMKMMNGMRWTPLLVLPIYGIFFGWLWSIAIGLQNKIPENVKMKVKKFKVLFFIPLIYISVIMVYFSFAFSSFIQMDQAPQVESMLGLFAVIFPLHLFSMFCIFYTLYFAAKTIKSVELQREVKFADFAGEFFMIWFYPIGIWIIQPKVNKMVGK